MNSRRIVSLRWLLPLLVAANGGCLNQAGPEWAKKVAFWEKEDVDPRGVLAPKIQMTALKELREALPSMPPAEQQAKAHELAQRYRNEADPILRAQMVRTIARCGSTAAGETLAAALRDSERDVRIAACEAWAEHQGPQAVGMLSDALRKDRSMDVRLAAARGLGKLPGPESVQALAPALQDPDPALQFRAVQSLRETTGKDFGNDVNLWREYVQGGTPSEISTAQRMKLDWF